MRRNWLSLSVMRATLILIALGVGVVVVAQQPVTVINPATGAAATLSLDQIFGTSTYTEQTTAGPLMGCVRTDGGGTLVNTTNEAGPCQMDSSGNIRMVGTVTANAGTNLNTSSLALDTTVDGLEGGVGASADAAATAGSTGSMSAKLRLITTQLDALQTELNAKTEPANSQTVTGTVALGAGTALVGSVVPWAAGTLASGAVTTPMTGTTTTSVIGATASNYIYVTNCTVSNASLTVSTDIILQDGSGGTTLWNIPAPAATVATTGGAGAVVVFPTPLRVPTSGNALYAANVTTGSSTKISCNGFKSTVAY